MAINPHHTVEEVAGVRCSVVEKGITKERAAFITPIIKQSGFGVLEEIKEDGTVTVGVTDLTFNPVHALYTRRLKHADGSVVSPAQWKQKASVSPEYYWQY